MMALMMCFVNTSFSQYSDTTDFSKVKFEKSYLGESFAFYKGCYFKIDTTQIGGFNHAFYKNFNDAIPTYGNNVAYPNKEYTFSTEIGPLKNRLFIVESILDKNGVEVVSVGYAVKPIFKLRDIKTNENLFYKYDTKYAHNFVFLTTKPQINDTVLIDSKITKTFDEIENKTTFYSPINMDVSIWRVIENNTETYYLSLEALGSTLNYGGTGVTILFTDKTKWSRPAEKIDVDYDSSTYYKYSAFIKLTKEDLKLFQTKTIKKFKLYIYDNNFDNGFLFQEYAKRIDKIKG